MQCRGYLLHNIGHATRRLDGGHNRDLTWVQWVTPRGWVWVHSRYDSRIGNDVAAGRCGYGSRRSYDFAAIGTHRAHHVKSTDKAPRLIFIDPMQMSWSE